MVGVLGVALVLALAGSAITAYAASRAAPAGPTTTPVPSASSIPAVGRPSGAGSPGAAEAKLESRYYSETNQANWIDFHADGTFYATVLGALSLSYAVNGSSVTLSGGIAGSVTGRLIGDTITFEGAGSGGIRNTLTGAWIRR